MIGTTFNNKVIEPGMNYFTLDNYHYFPEDELDFIGFIIGIYGPGEILHSLGAVEHLGDGAFG